MESGQEMGQESPSQAASQPKKTFSKTWLVLGLFIVVLGIGGWFAYVNYFSSPQVIEPTLPPTAPPPVDLNKELMEEEMKEVMEQDDEAVFQTVIDNTVFTLAELIAGITQGDVVIAGMRVQHVRPFREELSDKLPLEENIIVDFEGQVELTGEYYVNEFGRYCIHNLTQESLAKVPTLDSTQVLPWICFTNTKDVPSILGSASRAVTVTISDYSMQHHSPEPPNWATLVSADSEGEQTEGVVTYSNDEYGFSFNHPAGWNEYAVNDGSYTVVAFESSDTEQLLEEGQLPPGTRFNVAVNYWPTLSDFEELAPGIEVANLDELIEENVLFTKVGELQVDGYEAREIIWNGFGQSFAVLIDKDGELWMLNFERFEEKQDVTEVELEVINSFSFSQSSTKYIDNEYGFEFQPSDLFEIITTEVVATYSDGKEWYRVDLEGPTVSGLSSFFRFEINQDGYGPIFADQEYTVALTSDNMVEISDVEMYETTENNDDGSHTVIVNSLHLNDNWYTWKYWYPEELDLQDVMDEMLESFKIYNY